MSGTPVPTSPFVTISANASTPGVAIKGANAALKAVDAYARKLVSASSGGPALLSKVHAESIQVTKAQSALDRLKSQAGSRGRHRHPHPRRRWGPARAARSTSRPWTPASRVRSSRPARTSLRRRRAQRHAAGLLAAGRESARLAPDGHRQPGGERDQRPQSGRADRDSHRVAGGPARRPGRRAGALVPKRAHGLTHHGRPAHLAADARWR